MCENNTYEGNDNAKKCVQDQHWNKTYKLFNEGVNSISVVPVDPDLLPIT